MNSRWRPIGVGAAWAASVLVAVLLGWWAATQATNPPRIDSPSAQASTVEVTRGVVSVEQAYGIDVAWPSVPVGVNGYAGTLTSIALAVDGSSVDPGDVVYTVDLAPVVAVEGSVPAFRDMGAGARGSDVSQLQRFLIDAGYLDGSSDGHYGGSTAAAVNRWSASLGLPQTGMVPLGRIVFVPELPATLAPAPDVRPGLRVMPGDELLIGADAGPQFSFRVLPEAVSRTSEGLRVRIDADGQEWHAEVDRLAAAADGSGTTIAILRGVDEAASICGDECSAAVVLGADVVLPGVLILVPETQGAQVPTAAVVTDASGMTSVTLEDGTVREVTVLASSEGKSIVTGVEPGERVVVVSTSARE